MGSFSSGTVVLILFGWLKVLGRFSYGFCYE